MSRFTSWWPAAAVSLIATISSPVLGKEVDLRPKFEKGAETRFEMEVTGDSEQKPDEGAAIKQQVKQTIGVKLVGGDTDAEGNTSVSLVYESLKLEVKSDMMNLEFDSTQPETSDEGNMLASALRPLIGVTFTLTIDKTGAITKVAGNEAFSSGAISGLTSVDGIKAGLGPVFTTRNDDGKAEVGETWSYTDSLPMSPLGPMSIVSNHTLKDVSGNDANIDLTGKITVEANPAMKLKMDEGTYSGKYVWDTAKGMLKSLTIQQKMVMSGDIQPGTHGQVSTAASTKITRK